MPVNPRGEGVEQVLMICLKFVRTHVSDYDKGKEQKHHGHHRIG
jgi:hypothetical protein